MNTRIIEYKLIVHHSAHFMEEEVNALIGNGWEPLGGVSESHYTNNYQYAQAMVKRSSNSFPEQSS